MSGLPFNDASDACGCCDGVQAATPQAVFNRAGLAGIGYRIGRWADFRASLLAGLSSAEFPRLNGLLTRDEDDFTVALADAFACAADVLTFYQERTAHEHYLRTATERLSLQELGRLIGYRLRPGVAAETWLAFTLETPPAPPPNLKPEPGAFVSGVPERLSLAAGLKVQSVPGPDEKPQTFETVEALSEARPQWNAARPWLADAVRPGRGATFTYLAGVRTGLKPGDAVLLVDDDFTADPEAGGDRWDLRMLTRVEADAAADRTRIEWSRGLGSVRPRKNPAAEPQLHALRRRAAAFGHNAPMWASMPVVFKEQYPGGGSSTIGFAPDWPDFKASTRLPGQRAAWLDLDGVVSEAAAGSLVVVAKGEFNRSSGPAAGSYVELYQVRGNSEVSRAQFALSGKVTRLELAGENFAAQFFGVPRALTVFLQSERLDFAAHPVVTPVAGEWLPLDLPADGLHAGRRLVVRGERADGGGGAVHATTIRSVSAQGARCTLRLDQALPAALRRDSVVVHLNVALASHGETTTQILGSGDAATPFQRFELRQLPLTWRAAASEAGASPELTLRVGELRWSPRDTLHGAARDERAYALRDDEQGRLWVEFGDGVQGARLPGGQGNVRATYRSGIGAAGNVRAETLTQLGARPLGLKGVANPLQASGGTDPEAADDARRNMPLATRTLGRVVSLPDYEDHARAYAGIAKAQAAVLALPRGRCIVITVAAPEGATIDETSPVWTGLLAALKAAGDPLVPVQLLAAQRSPLHLGLRVRCDPERDEAAVLAAVEQALREDFGFLARELGQPVQRSAVLASAHRVPGVLAVQLTALYGGSAPAAQTLPGVHERLLAGRLRVGAGGLPLPAELLTLHTGPLARLEAMP